MLAKIYMPFQELAVKSILKKNLERMVPTSLLVTLRKTEGPIAINS